MPNLRVAHYRIHVSRTGAGPESPFSAVFLSDLHDAFYGEGNGELLAAIRAQEPEVVLVGGDMLTVSSKNSTKMESALILMEKLTEQYPVYYVNGNHETRLSAREDHSEYDRYREQICGYGVHLLSNTCERIVIRRMPIDVWGLELPMDYYQLFHRKALSGETMKEFLGEAKDCGAFRLLLAHNPVYFDAYATWGADLTLAGHLHGGLIRLPLLGGVASPQFRPFPKYDRGLFEKGDARLVVSAGLGDHTVHLRINNPPELVVLDFL